MYGSFMKEYLRNFEHSEKHIYKTKNGTNKNSQ